MPANIVMDHIWNDLLPDRYKKTVSDPGYLKGLLVGAYGQPARLYHDMAHLHAMLSELKRTPLHCSNNMYSAILFHDIVYEMHGPTGQNEELSFRFFVDEAAFLFNFDADLEQIEKLILATKHDRDLGSDYKGPHHQDPNYESKLIADLDLSGFQRTGYLNDHMRVVGEYFRTGYSRMAVAEGRLQFLNAFVARDPFYYFTDLFDADRARANIRLLISDTKKEIANMKNGAYA